MLDSATCRHRRTDRLRESLFARCLVASNANVFANHHHALCRRGFARTTYYGHRQERFAGSNSWAMPPSFQALTRNTLAPAKRLGGLVAPLPCFHYRSAFRVCSLFHVHLPGRYATLSRRISKMGHWHRLHRRRPENRVCLGDRGGCSHCLGRRKPLPSVEKHRKQPELTCFFLIACRRTSRTGVS